MPLLLHLVLQEGWGAEGRGRSQFLLGTHPAAWAIPAGGWSPEPTSILQAQDAVLLQDLSHSLYNALPYDPLPSLPWEN